MDLLDGYLSCVVHDLKKMLLNSRRDAKPVESYGTWRGVKSQTGHVNLNDLWIQVEPTSGIPQQIRLARDTEQHDKLLRLAMLHQGEDVDVDPRGLDPVAIYAIRAADAAHKALYAAGEMGEERIREAQVGLDFPCYYPFYGEAQVWIPEDIRQVKNKVGARYCFDDFHLINSLERFRKIVNAVEQQVQGEGLTPAFLTALLEDIACDFPESTYLPITSLNFHLRLAGALFLMFYREFRRLTVPAQAMLDHEVVIYLNVAETPPETLRHRLRDVPLIRKISHRLQETLHRALRRKFEASLKAQSEEEREEVHRAAEVLFPDTRTNPFLFYNKDALVVLCGEPEQEGVREVCNRIAAESETTIALRTIPVKLSFTLSVRNWQRHQGKTLRKIPPQDTGDVKFPQVETLPSEVRHYVQPTHFAQNDEQACVVCGKPGKFRSDWRGDTLCPTCHGFRYDFKFCPDCRVYVRKAPDRHYEDPTPCPYCGQTTQKPLSPDLLNDQSAVRRIAYVVLATNCTPEDIKHEAEILMAWYRQERQRFKPSQNRDQLAKTRRTRFGLYEYLQAVLDVNRLQEHLAGRLWSRLPRRDAQLSPRERRAVIESYFLYRSPTMTVILLPEEEIAAFWQDLMAALDDLNVSWLAKVVLCSTHFPVWGVVRKVLERLPQGFLPQASEWAEEVRRLAKEWHEEDKKDKEDRNVALRDAVFDQGDKLLDKADEDRRSVHSQFSGLVVLRGGVERRLPIGAADYLFTESAPSDRSTTSQLGELSEFARCAVAGRDDASDEERQAALDAFALELDSRTAASYGERGKIHRDLAHNLYEEAGQVKLSQIPGLVRELAWKMKTTASRRRDRNVQQRGS